MKYVIKLSVLSLMTVALFALVANASAAAPVITNERVQLRTLATGEVVAQVSATVEDSDTLSGLGVTVERPGVFGPFPLQPGLYRAPGEAPFPTPLTSDAYSVSIGTDFISAAQRAGDYLITVDDGVTSVVSTVTLPSGLTPLSPGGSLSQINVDTSTGLLRPTISIPAIPSANGYRISIINDSDSTSETFDGVSGTGLASIPTIRVGSGRLEAGKFYRFSMTAFDSLTVASSTRRSESAEICYDPVTGRTDIPCLTQKDVHLVTESDGNNVMLTIGRVLDKNDLNYLKSPCEYLTVQTGTNPCINSPAPVPVTVTRGSFGPFPLTSSILLNVDIDSDVVDQFTSARNPLDSTQIPSNQRAGDYTFSAKDSDPTSPPVSVNRIFPSGVDPFPTTGPLTIDASSGALTPTISIPAVEPIPVPSGRVGWWRGDGDATDSQFGNHGTPINGTTFAQGLTALGTRQAFSFPTGTNAYVSLGNPGDLQFAGDFTITAWLKPTTSTGDHIFTRRSAGCGPLDYQIQREFGDQLTASAGSFAQSFSGLTIPANKFSFVAVVFHNAAAPRTVDFYVNRATALGVPANGTIGLLGSAEVQIGQANGCIPETHFDGLIDEVQVFDRALSSQEIDNLYQAPNAARYRVVVFNDTDSTRKNFDDLPGGTLSESPSMQLFPGVIEADKFYRIHMDAFNNETFSTTTARSRSVSKRYDPSGLDSDSDGIQNSLDLSPSFSDAFSNVSLGGNVSGTIINRADLDVVVIEPPNTAANGLRIGATGGGSGSAELVACLSTVTHWLTERDAEIVKCGSLIVEVLDGAIEYSLGAEGTVIAPAGAKLTIREPILGQYSVETALGSVVPITLIKNGQQIVLQPGAPGVSLPTVEIKPGDAPNCVNPKSKGFVPVAIYGGNIDVATVVQSSLRLDADVNANTPGLSPAMIAIKDVDGDGINDLIFHFKTQDLQSAGLLSNGRTLFLTAQLTNGTLLVGSDVISLSDSPTCN